GTTGDNPGRQHRDREVELELPTAVPQGVWKVDHVVEIDHFDRLEIEAETERMRHGREPLARVIDVFRDDHAAQTYLIGHARTLADHVHQKGHEEHLLLLFDRILFLHRKPPE